MAAERGEAGLKAGDRHYKAFIGPPELYDLMGAMQFNLLTALGLRQHHHLLDLGCGSLRAGKLLIPYLLPDHYFGIEPEQWLIDDGLRRELGQDIVAVKRPRFDNNNAFQLTVFGQQFDYIIAQSVLSHSSAAQARACLSEAGRALNPTGVFAATFVAGEKDYEGETWSYPEVVSYTLGFMTALVREAGLVYRPLDWPHPTGQTWFAAVRPGCEELVRDVSGEASALPDLKARLREVEDTLARIRLHPYVKLGRWVRGLLRGKTR